LARASLLGRQVEVNFIAVCVLGEEVESVVEAVKGNFPG
jgi:hypothetical protein